MCGQVLLCGKNTDLLKATCQGAIVWSCSLDIKTFMSTAVSEQALSNHLPSKSFVFPATTAGSSCLVVGWPVSLYPSIHLPVNLSLPIHAYLPMDSSVHIHIVIYQLVY